MTEQSERGIALVAASMAMMLLLALGASLILVTSSETAIAANFRTGSEALYAAQAVVERSIAELRTVDDWSSLLDGSAQSSFVDGPASGTRRLADGSTLDLAQVVSMANCLKQVPCTDGEVAAKSPSRPWGANNPRWTLFAHGMLDDLAGGTPQGSAFYVVAMVGDDGAENDDDPRHDGLPAGALPNPGKNIILVRGETYGARGARRAVEAVISRRRADELDPASAYRVRVHSWKEF